MTTLGDAAVGVLATAEPRAKAAAARACVAAWSWGELDYAAGAPPPDAPARPAFPELLPPSRMPKRGRAGSARTRVAMLHAVAHIELNAIDLAADVLARFAPACPRAFADDWARVLDEEAQHFLLLADRLEAMGAAYGDLPAHDGLWDAARSTAHDLAARLAIVPQVLEARGLDVTPAMITRFEAAGDGESAAILARILHDEVGHVGVGHRWYRWAVGEKASAATFHEHVRANFRGLLKPPFNDSARRQAGLPPEWYRPLAQPVS